MNIQLAAILENLKIGDLKSSMDQIKSLYTEVSLVKEEIADLYNKLNEKISLASRMSDGTTQVTKIGAGIISSITNIGTTLNGTGTLFTKEIAVSNEIKIGSEITVVMAIISDTEITVEPAINGNYINQIYAIIKPATLEVLTGSFDFGQLNGDTFTGIVKQNSVLEHYGRMSSTNDVVNLGYVQKSINPVMVRAQNAIQRDGDDIIGPAGTQYTYNFDRTAFNFDIDTELKYSGTVADPLQLTPKVYVDNAVSQASSSVRSFVYYHSPTTVINLASSSVKELDFLEKYFTPSGIGLKCIKKCMCIIHASFSGYTGVYKDRDMNVVLEIKQNSTVLNRSSTKSWSSSASSNQNEEELSTSVFAMTTFEVTDILTIPLSHVGSELVECNNSVGIVAFSL